MLFTRISTPGCWRTSSAAVDATLKSPAKPDTVDPVVDAMRATASSTPSAVRPFTMTSAPSAASARAIAKPMPAVLPETRASLLAS
jgi:hypothetical protein